MKFLNTPIADIDKAFNVDKSGLSKIMGLEIPSGAFALISMSPPEGSTLCPDLFCEATVSPVSFTFNKGIFAEQYPDESGPWWEHIEANIMFEEGEATIGGAEGEIACFQKLPPNWVLEGVFTVKFLASFMDVDQIPLGTETAVFSFNISYDKQWASVDPIAGGSAMSAAQRTWIITFPYEIQNATDLLIPELWSAQTEELDYSWSEGNTVLTLSRKEDHTEPISPGDAWINWGGELYTIHGQVIIGEIYYIVSDTLMHLTGIDPPDSSEISATPVFTATFDFNVDVASTYGDNVALYVDGVIGPVSCTIEVVGNVITVTPDSPLEYSTLYRLEFLHFIYSVEGYFLDTDYLFYYTTEEEPPPPDPTYQWYYSTSKTGPWQQWPYPGSSQGQSNYITVHVTPEATRKFYRCTVGNAEGFVSGGDAASVYIQDSQDVIFIVDVVSGNNTIYSNVVLANIFYSLVEDVYVSVGDNPEFSLTCRYDETDPEIIFQWDELIDGEWTFYADTQNFQIMGVSLADNGRQFRNITITPSGEFYTNTATLHVSE